MWQPSPGQMPDRAAALKLRRSPVEESGSRRGGGEINLEPLFKSATEQVQLRNGEPAVPWAGRPVDAEGLPWRPRIKKQGRLRYRALPCRMLPGMVDTSMPLNFPANASALVARPVPATPPVIPAGALPAFPATLPATLALAPLNDSEMNFCVGNQPAHCCW